MTGGQQHHRSMSMTDDTSTTPHHPFRDAQLSVYRRLDGGECVAMFAPFDSYPILFRAPTEDDVRQKAEAFRHDAIERHEAAFIARSEALSKARAARMAKIKDAQA